MNAPQHLHRSSAMGSTVGHIPANSWASCRYCFHKCTFCQKLCNVEQNWVSAIWAHAAESRQVDDGQLQPLQNSASRRHFKGNTSTVEIVHMVSCHPVLEHYYVVWSSKQCVTCIKFCYNFLLMFANCWFVEHGVGHLWRVHGKVAVQVWQANDRINCHWWSLARGLSFTLPWRHHSCHHRHHLDSSFELSFM